MLDWVMGSPYRDQHLTCPACKATLREFQGRQVCDGMLLTLKDLAHAIHDLTSVVPTFEYRDEAPGKRLCPRCTQAMTTCKLEVVLDGEIEQPRPELDRCVEHGIWFDGKELASVFEKVANKGYGGGVAHPGAVAPLRTVVGSRSRSGVPEWWGSLGGSRNKS